MRSLRFVWAEIGMGGVVSVCAAWGGFEGLGGAVDAVLRTFAGGEPVIE